MLETTLILYVCLIWSSRQHYEVGITSISQVKKLRRIKVHNLSKVMQLSEGIITKGEASLT